MEFIIYIQIGCMIIVVLKLREENWYYVIIRSLKYI